MSVRKRLFDLLDHGGGAGLAGIGWQSVIVATVLTSATCLVLSTEPQASSVMIALCSLVERIALVVFGTEYALRIWVAPEDLRFKNRAPLHARRSYLLSAAGIIDLIAILPIAFNEFGAGGRELAIAFGLLRCLKLVRYSSSLQILLETILREKAALLAGATIILGLAIIAGGFVYALESPGQPDKFGALRPSIWWAVETIVGSTTARASPETAIGRAIAALLTVSGFMMLALPVGIVSASFENSFRQRDFTVSTGMVGKVRMFASLHADEIVSIATSLRSRRFFAGETIITQGDIGEEMYFIMAGSVIVTNAGGQFTLREGDYFGERALVLTEPRNSSVVAATTVKALCLGKEALSDLIRRRPEIASELMQTIEARASVVAPS